MATVTAITDISEIGTDHDITNATRYRPAGVLTVILTRGFLRRSVAIAVARLLDIRAVPTASLAS